MAGRNLRKCLNSSVLCRALTVLVCLSFLALRVCVAHEITNGPAKAGTVAAAAQLVIMTPEVVGFVDVPVGDTYTQTVKITNVGQNTLQITKITPSNADFRISGILLPVVVAHGTSESFTIAYRARVEGKAEGQISIVTNSGDAPVVLSVKASAAREESELTANTAGIDFQDVATGSADTRELVLTNSGNRDLSISGISASGAGFSLAGATAIYLSAGQSVSVDVKFVSRSVGHQMGSLSVASSDGGRLLSIPLAATGARSSQSTVRLNWEESPVMVAGYVVYRSAEPSGPFTRVSDAAVPSAEYLDTGLAAGHTYFYVVTSLNPDDQTESEYSAPISATVPEG